MAGPKALECPLCNFTNHDDYALQYHVETSHPEEDGPSPFAVTESVRQDVVKDDGDEEGAKDSAPDYIECQCGEFCLLTEFENHLEMHHAEGTVFDETKPTSTDLALPGTTLHYGRATSPATQPPPPSPLMNAVPASSKSLVVRTKPRNQTRVRSGKSQTVVQDFIDVLRHSSPLPSRKVSKAKTEKVPQRLGQAELGPHAHEERMPDWLRKQLEHGAKITTTTHIGRDGRLVQVQNVANECRDIIPVLAQLCDQDPTVSRVYLCHPDVTHVAKMHREGGFCGYRNIQMLVSYIRDARSEGYRHFSGNLPSVIRLQDMIETAWDMGFNTVGRIETGGIRGTRKFIGTPEAQALLQSLDIGCRAEAFNEGTEMPVQQNLLQAAEQYFLDGDPSIDGKVYRTSLPPMYFQHPGHSLTIVGLEVRKNGSRVLLVFDPMFKTSDGIRRLLGLRFRTSAPDKLLKAYRRGEEMLRKYSTFEVLKLTARVPDIR